MNQRRGRSPKRRQEAAFHATPWHGVIQTCPVEGNKRSQLVSQGKTWSGDSAGMKALRLLKGRRLVARSITPERKDDPRPDVGESANSHSVTFAFHTLAVVVLSGPPFLLGTLPSKLMHGVAQRLDARVPTVGFGVLSAFVEDRCG